MKVIKKWLKPLVFQLALSQSVGERKPFIAIWIREIKYISLVEAEENTGIKHYSTLAARAKNSNYPDIKIDGMVKTQRSEKMGKIAVSVTVEGVKYKTSLQKSSIIEKYF